MAEMMVSIFGDVRRYILFELDPPLFNMEKFMSTQSPLTRPFYKLAVLLLGSHFHVD
jgi:hypothetical protein